MIGPDLATSVLIGPEFIFFQRRFDQRLAVSSERTASTNQMWGEHILSMTLPASITPHNYCEHLIEADSFSISFHNFIEQRYRTCL